VLEPEQSGQQIQQLKVDEQAQSGSRKRSGHDRDRGKRFSQAWGVALEGFQHLCARLCPSYADLAASQRRLASWKASEARFKCGVSSALQSMIVALARCLNAVLTAISRRYLRVHCEGRCTRGVACSFERADVIAANTIPAFVKFITFGA
jgi:hypothetical protein